MKKTIIATSTVLLLVIALSLYLLNGCKKNVDPLQSSDKYVITGKVINSETNEPLANTVILVRGITQTLSTNAEGVFSFYVSNKQDYTAIAKNNGFVDKVFKIVNVADGFYSPTVEMKPVGISQSIGTGGGQISTTNYYEKKAKVEIPAGALSATQTLSATSTWGIENPAIDVANTILVESLCLSPENVILAKKASVTLTAPFELSDEKNLVVYRYNNETGKWDGVSTEILVDGATATFKISKLGLYILGMNGSFTEELVQEYTETVETNKSDRSLSLKPTLNLASNLYDIPIEYLEGIANQYYQVKFNKTNDFFLNQNGLSALSLKSGSISTICFDICWKKIKTKVCFRLKIRYITIPVCIPIDCSIPYPCNLRMCHSGGAGH